MGVDADDWLRHHTFLYHLVQDRVLDFAFVSFSRRKAQNSFSEEVEGGFGLLDCVDK